MAELLQLIQQYTGQQRVTSSAEAAAIVAECQANLERALQGSRRTEATLPKAIGAFRRARLRYRVAELALRTGLEPWLLTLLLTSALALLVGLPATALRLDTIWLGAIVLLPFVVGFAGMPIWFPTDTRHLKEQLDLRQGAVDAARASVRSADTQVRQATAATNDAQALFHGLQRALAEPMHRLLAVRPETLSGDGFERFLAEVFELRGYGVTRTGRSGDQGVDLILARAGARIAVQAKCYQGSVGNDAVQQVFAGKQHYGCDRCVVITSSYFTNSAKALSVSVRCTLIEGSQIPLLIRGELSI